MKCRFVNERASVRSARAPTLRSLRPGGGFNRSSKLKVRAALGCGESDTDGLRIPSRVSSVRSAGPAPAACPPCATTRHAAAVTDAASLRRRRRRLRRHRPVPPAPAARRYPPTCAWTTQHTVCTLHSGNRPERSLRWKWLSIWIDRIPKFLWSIREDSSCC